ncbi:MAG: methylaspartate mutase subunit E, partial [Spirochaetota bacterium]
MSLKKELKNKKIDIEQFFEERNEVIKSWPTGKDILNIDEGVKYQKEIPESKKFSKVLIDADKNNITLIQPRAGVALLD